MCQKWFNQVNNYILWIENFIFLGFGTIYIADFIWL